MDVAISRLDQTIQHETALHAGMIQTLELEVNRHVAIITCLKNLLDDLKNINVSLNRDDNSENVDGTDNRSLRNTENLRRRRTERPTTSNNITRRNLNNRNRSLRSMTVSSKKQLDFIIEPVGHKKVDQVPGIGPQAAAKLNRRGIGSALKLIGQALLMDKEEFKRFLCEVGVRNHSAGQAWEAILQYKEQNM